MTERNISLYFSGVKYSLATSADSEQLTTLFAHTLGRVPPKVFLVGRSARATRDNFQGQIGLASERIIGRERAQHTPNRHKNLWVDKERNLFCASRLTRQWLGVSLDVPD